MIDTGSIKSWTAKNVVLKPNEAVAIMSDGKVQDILAETALKEYVGGFGRWLGAKLGMGVVDHKMLFCITGPFDLLFLVKGQLRDGSMVNGLATLRMQINREDLPKLLNLFTSGPREIKRGRLVKVFQTELDQKATAPLLTALPDASGIRSQAFQESFEMAVDAEMRNSFGLVGLTLLRAFVTFSETDVERLASYRAQSMVLQSRKDVDAEVELAELERQRELTLRRIGIETDLKVARARGNVDAQMESELKDLKVQEAHWKAEVDHERAKTEVQNDAHSAKADIAMQMFEQVQAAKRARMAQSAGATVARQAQSDSLQEKMMHLAADSGAMTPEVMQEFLQQQTAQKEAEQEGAGGGQTINISTTGDSNPDAAADSATESICPHCSGEVESGWNVCPNCASPL
jgi:hypothetical protein